MSLLVVGSIAFDTVETPFGEVKDALGGSATYISAAASYFDPPVRMVAVVGGDFPSDFLSFFEEHQIDLDGLQTVKEGKTFRWGGRYHYDLNSRDTLFTELNVFKEFNPVIPENYKRSAYVCLGNIDPLLQRKVLEQITKPRLVVGDTMNYWIESKPDELRKTLKRVDVIIVNDSEARLLTQEPNLVKAAKRIIEMGPRVIIIKKGEHGALLVTQETIFAAPAYPLETIFDPTGAGDAFAGGFVGWLAKTDDLSPDNLKRAVIYGSTLASFCVEKFSVDGLRELTYLEIQDRYRSFMNLSRFDERTG
ncbi:MAG: PfkB family carbohydrate kinase [Bacteroidota bacterium]